MTKASEEGIAVIEMGKNEAVDNKSEADNNGLIFCNVSEEGIILKQFVDMVFKFQLTGKYNAKIPRVWLDIGGK